MEVSTLKQLKTVKQPGDRQKRKLLVTLGIVAASVVLFVICVV